MKTLLATIALAFATVSTAAELRLESPVHRVALVELYTSEGCSSCPPADRWIAGLLDDPRLWRELVPVAFHVDYWDDIGWPDRFADPAHADRQRSYARGGHLSAVYTPGWLVAGREWRTWFRRPVLALGRGPQVGRLAIRVEGDAFSAAFSPEHSPASDLQLHVAVLGFGLSTEVRAGENRGRRLEHDFVVLGHRRLPLAAARGRFTAKGALPPRRIEAPRLGLAAWVSAADDPRPLQAVGGWLGD